MRSGIPDAVRPSCPGKSSISERHQNPTAENENAMTATLLFRELILLPTLEWTTERLNLLPVIELSGLCRLTGIRHSGTKRQLVERLVDQTQLQRCIRHYWTILDSEVTTSQIQLLATTYPGRELKAMCRRAGCYALCNKVCDGGESNRLESRLYPPRTRGLPSS